ncbi:MAG: CHAT domain-containing protein [Anaerolineae bacterium]|jgi:hypothetical protein
MIKSYKNFDLRVSGHRTAGFTVHATNGNGGQSGSQPLILPPDRSFKERLDAVLAGTSDAKAIQQTGQEMYASLFPAPVATLWARAIEGLSAEEGLRLRLHIEPAILNLFPWELIFNGDYVGLHLRHPIVRYLEPQRSPTTLRVKLPLRVLLAGASPRDQSTVEVGAQIRTVQSALAQLPGRYEVDVLHPARHQDLVTALSQGYHLLHFVGPSRFAAGKGYLFLENEEGRSDPISAQRLGQMLAESNVRVVILDACRSATTPSPCVLNGVARQLVRQGLPAVVAMQQAIAEDSAFAFGHEFYGALADGWPIDAAVQEGRRGIVSMQGTKWREEADWAVPTLYMGTPDGRVLTTAQAPGTPTLKRPRPTSMVSYSTRFHGDVHGPVHTGGGDIHIGSIQYGVDADELNALFQSLYELVETQAPPESKAAAIEKVDELQQAVTEKKPNLDRMEAVQNWFKKHIPRLAGAVTSVILNPLVGKLVESAGEMIAEEFKRRFGP